MKIGISMLLSLLTMFAAPALFAEDCLLCGSGSSNGCQQCRGTDRKACEAKGCKISGTASCSTAANVKICNVEKPMIDLTFYTPKFESKSVK
ncbi:MAG: hypothetical protein O9264_10395 [Leptospira sp.]|nr:hypothetical protein [Leptospira sp.]